MSQKDGKISHPVMAIRMWSWIGANLSILCHKSTKTAKHHSRAASSSHKNWQKPPNIKQRAGPKSGAAMVIRRWNWSRPKMIETDMLEEINRTKRANQMPIPIAGWDLTLVRWSKMEQNEAKMEPRWGSSVPFLKAAKYWLNKLFRQLFECKPSYAPVQPALSRCGRILFWMP